MLHVIYHCRKFSFQRNRVKIRVPWHRHVFKNPEGELLFENDSGQCRSRAAATVLAMGGASWPQLGNNGNWTDYLAAEGVLLQPFGPANGGFDAVSSSHYLERHAGRPLKRVRLSFIAPTGEEHTGYPKKSSCRVYVGAKSLGGGRNSLPLRYFTKA